MEFLKKYLHEVSDTLATMDLKSLDQGRAILQSVGERKGGVFMIGNGGSAATASHFACDLYKRSGIRSKALTDQSSLFTALANDLEYAAVFAWQVEREMGPEDGLVAISASGNSPNILRGIAAAKARGATTIGLVGFDGGQLKDQVDCCILVRSESMEQVEDIHLVLCHALACCLRKETR